MSKRPPFYVPDYDKGEILSPEDARRIVFWATPKDLRSGPTKLEWPIGTNCHAGQEGYSPLVAPWITDEDDEDAPRPGIAMKETGIADAYLTSGELLRCAHCGSIHPASLAKLLTHHAHLPVPRPYVYFAPDHYELPCAPGDQWIVQFPDPMNEYDGWDTFLGSRRADINNCWGYPDPIEIGWSAAHFEDLSFDTLRYLGGLFYRATGACYYREKEGGPMFRAIPGQGHLIAAEFGWKYEGPPKVWAP